MWRDDPVGLAIGVVAMARPCVVTGVLAEPGTHRVELDVLIADAQVTLGGDVLGDVAPLPQAAGALVQLVEISDIADVEQVHRLRQRRFVGRRHEQVDVVAHQDVAVHRASVLVGRIDQKFEVMVAIVVTKEDRAAVITALYHVHGHAWDERSMLAGH